MRLKKQKLFLDKLFSPYGNTARQKDCKSKYKILITKYLVQENRVKKKEKRFLILKEKPFQSLEL